MSANYTSARHATLYFFEGTARLTLGVDTMTATPGTYVVMRLTMINTPAATPNQFQQEQRGQME